MKIDSKYQHRTSHKEIKVLQKDGSVLANTPITITQTKHKFLFGCGAFDAVPLANGMLSGDEKFAAAKAANPGATLLINDFNTSISYEILIEGCLEAGIPIDVIGIQSHQHQGYWGMEKLQSVLERFSGFGLPIHFTENTIISGNRMPPEIDDLNDFQVTEWPTTPDGEERQAREITEMYRTLFEHKLVESVTTWSIVDGKWLHAPAGFLRADNSYKPVYDELHKLIKQDWWTTLQLVTDAEGKVAFDGYMGDYLLTDGKRQASFVLEAGSVEEVLVL